MQKQQLPARQELVVGFRTLVARLGRAHMDVRPKDERAAYAMALKAVGDFLTVNGTNSIIPVWLADLASALTDLDDGIVGPLLRTEKHKSLPSKIWRRSALVAVGMTALTMAGVKREEAARCALRIVKTIQGTPAKIILSRHDDFHKDRVKNREGARVFSWANKRLKAYSSRADANLEKAASIFFQLANRV